MGRRDASDLLLEALMGHEERGLSIEDALLFLMERGYERDVVAAAVLSAIDTGKIRLGDRLRLFAALEAV
jgi:hypothetical protein